MAKLLPPADVSTGKARAVHRPPRWHPQSWKKFCLEGGRLGGRAVVRTHRGLPERGIAEAILSG